MHRACDDLAIPLRHNAKNYSRYDQSYAAYFSLHTFLKILSVANHFQNIKSNTQ